MRIIFFIGILFLVSRIGFSQSDSLYYWKSQRIDAIMKISTGITANSIGSIGVFINGWGDIDAVNAFLVYNTIGITMDVWGLIQLNKSIRNIKRLKNSVVESDGQ